VAEGALAFQNGRIQSKLIEVQQQSNEAPDCCSEYQGNPRKSLFFLICSISGILTICYFSRAFSYFKIQKKVYIFNEINNCITLALSTLEIKSS